MNDVCVWIFKPSCVFHAKIHAKISFINILSRTFYAFCVLFVYFLYVYLFQKTWFSGLILYLLHLFTLDQRTLTVWEKKVWLLWISASRNENIVYSRPYFLARDIFSLSVQVQTICVIRCVCLCVSVAMIGPEKGAVKWIQPKFGNLLKFHQISWNFGSYFSEPKKFEILVESKLIPIVVVFHWNQIRNGVCIFFSKLHICVYACVMMRVASSSEGLL